MMDFISKLPDSVLISIISRIQIDEAVRTSILSKRWTNLYKFVPVINFTCYDFVDKSTYCDLDLDVDHTKAFVDISKFLGLHSGTIRSFSALCCLTKSSAQALEQCTHSLGESGIQKLRLYFSCRAQLKPGADFPCHLISNMPTLKEFNMTSCYLQPSPVTSSSLNTLQLSGVSLVEGSLECILSGCLNLHTLRIGGSRFSCPDNKKASFCGPNLQLKCLMIHNPEGLESIEVYASNLVTFELFSEHIDVIDGVNFEYAPQLQNVYLCLYDIRVVPNVCRKLAKDLPNLKAFAYETRGKVGNVHQGGNSICMPISNMFSCLKLLRLDMSAFGHEFKLLSLIPLLHSCPLLQEFQLAASRAPLEKNVQEEEMSVIVAHSHLKKVDMSGFEGSKNEMDFALYILKSAVVLEEMLISRLVSIYSGFGCWNTWPGPKWSQETDKEIQEQLKNEAVSKTARVIVQTFPRFKWKWFTNYAILMD